MHILEIWLRVNLGILFLSIFHINSALISVTLAVQVVTVQEDLLMKNTMAACLVKYFTKTVVYKYMYHSNWGTQ